MVAYRTDTADSWRDYWHLPENSALAEFFEASKLCYVEFGINHIACFIQLDGHLAVSFNSANWIYLYCPFDFRNHVFTSFNRSASYRWAEQGFCLPGARLRHTR